METDIVGLIVDSNAKCDSSLVSILMPAYNHDKFIEQAVRSVWEQTYSNIELIVVDDGSKDRSLELLQQLGEVSPIPMKVFTQENKGITCTLNRCLDIAKGEWVALLASDDYYDKCFISRSLNEAEQYGDESIVVHSDAIKIDDEGIELGRHSKNVRKPGCSGFCFDELVNSSVSIVSPTIFLPLKALRNVGGFDENLLAEDYDLHLRLARQYKFVYIDEPLIYKRDLRFSLGEKPWVWTSGVVTALEKHADILGDKLPGLIERKLYVLSVACVSQGSMKNGARLGRQAIKNTSSLRQKLFLAMRLFSAWPVALVRFLSVKYLPKRCVEKVRLIKKTVRYFRWKR